MGSDDGSIHKLHEICRPCRFLVNIFFLKCDLLLTVSAESHADRLIGKLDPRAFQRYIYHGGVMRGTYRTKRPKGYISWAKNGYPPKNPLGDHCAVVGLPRWHQSIEEV